MRCPSCGYVSFDHLAACKSCGKAIPGAAGGRAIPTSAPSTNLPSRAAFDPAGGPDFGAGPAGFWIRFVAAFVDGIILFLLLLAALLLMALPAGIMGGLDDPLAMIELLMRLGFVLPGISFLLNLLYPVILVGWRGQTVGKMLLGLKIIRVDGGEVGYFKAFIRWIGQVISGLILLIGYILAAFTENKRALHDFIAGTRVIRL
jgi:uncharacterized RDD family membrane protein YckC